MSFNDSISPVGDLSPEIKAQAKEAASWLTQITTPSGNMGENSSAAYAVEPANDDTPSTKVHSAQIIAFTPRAAAAEQAPSADTGEDDHILDFARGALAKLRATRASTGDADLDGLISQLATNIEQSNVNGLRDMLDDISTAIDNAAAKAQQSDTPEETPEQKMARLIGEIKQLDKEIDTLDAKLAQWNYGDEELKEEIEAKKKRLAELQVGSDEWKALGAEIAKDRERYYKDYGDKARADGNTEAADTADQAGDAAKSQTRVFKALNQQERATGQAHSKANAQDEDVQPRENFFSTNTKEQKQSEQPVVKLQEDTPIGHIALGSLLESQDSPLPTKDKPEALQAKSVEPTKEKVTGDLSSMTAQMSKSMVETNDIEPPAATPAAAKTKSVIQLT